MFSTKTQKERKGLDTSPFGALHLTTVPIPCVSIVFQEVPSTNAVGRLGLWLTPSYDADSSVARLPRVPFSVLRSPGRVCAPCVFVEKGWPYSMRESSAREANSWPRCSLRPVKRR